MRYSLVLVICSAAAHAASIFFEAGNTLVLPSLARRKQPAHALLLLGDLENFVSTAYVDIARDLSDELGIFVGILGGGTKMVQSNSQLLRMETNRLWNQLNDNSNGTSFEKVTLAGHGPGGLAMAHLLVKYREELTFKVDSLVLFASPLPLEEKSALHDLPVLSLAGDRDGIISMFHFAALAHRPLGNHTFLLLDGFSYRSFVTMRSVGKRPGTSLLNRDFDPMVDSKKGHDILVDLVGKFFQDQKTSLTSMQKQTRVRYLPIVDALMLEGSYTLEPPCFLRPDTECFRGSPWTEHAQREISNLTSNANITLQVTDAYHYAWSIVPFFHPTHNVTGDCKQGSCVIEVCTVSQSIYLRKPFASIRTNKFIIQQDADMVENEVVEDQATEERFQYEAQTDQANAMGIFSPAYPFYGLASAHQIRAKMISRQHSLILAGNATASFEELDASVSLCSLINENAIRWAHRRMYVPNFEDDLEYLQRIRHRFAHTGTSLRVSPDAKAIINGGEWIFLPLRYEASSSVMYVQSTPFQTAHDFPVPLSNGLHYCHLLSPARALEWVYNEGLRRSW